MLAAPPLAPIAFPRRSPRSRRLTLLALALVSLVVATVGFRVLTAVPGSFMEDDSYFYAQIAYELGNEHHSSFDGLHQTDGYHLLWGGALAAIAQLVHPLTTDKSLQLVPMMAAYLFLVLLTAVWFVRHPFGSGMLAAIGLYSVFLMESALLTLLLAFMVGDLLTEQQPRARSYLAAALTPLVRIDAAVIVAVWLLLWLLRGRRREALRLTACLALGTLTQLALMRLCFGHFFSVSAVLKTGSASHVLANLHQNLLVGLRGRSLMLAILLGYALAALPRQRAARWLVLGVLAGPGAYMAAQLALNHDVRSWYTAPALALFALVGLVLPPPSARLLAPRRLLPLVVTVAFVAVASYRSMKWWAVARASDRFVALVDEQVPAGDAIFQTDGAGFVGYFSHRHIIDGDGLVNDHDYALRLRRNQLQDYLVANDIRYVITDLSPEPDLTALIALYGHMQLPPGAPEKLLSSAAADAPGNVFWNFRLYRIGRAR